MMMIVKAYLLKIIVIAYVISLLPKTSNQKCSPQIMSSNRYINKRMLYKVKSKRQELRNRTLSNSGGLLVKIKFAT